MTDGLKKACEETFPGKIAIITAINSADYRIDMESSNLSKEMIEDFESRLMTEGFIISDVQSYHAENPSVSTTVRKMEAGIAGNEDRLKAEIWQATDPRLFTLPGIQQFYACISNNPGLMRCYQKRAIVSLEKRKAIEVAKNACLCYTQLVNPGDVIRVENKAFIVLPVQAGFSIHDISSTFNSIIVNRS